MLLPLLSEELLKEVTSPWNEIVHKSMFNSTKKGAYSELSIEKKMLRKIQNENLLQKGGGSDQPSMKHRIFLHFFITKERANMPRYIFRHMLKELRESQDNNKCWVPYGRLVSEILHQGGILNAMKDINFFTDEQLGTETGKIINGKTRKNMGVTASNVYKQLSTYLKESNVVSIMMEDFPPICKQDRLEVQMNFIKDHYATTGKKIRLKDVPETMYGGALPVAKSRKTMRKALTKDEYLGDAPEQPAKEAKRAKKDKKAAVQENTVGVAIPTIQEEVEDLKAEKILPKRTRSGKAAATSQSSPDQPSIQKRKRKTVERKLKESRYGEDEDQIAEATDLVTRELKKKKVEVESTLQKDAEVAASL